MQICDKDQNLRPLGVKIVKKIQSRETFLGTSFRRFLRKIKKIQNQNFRSSEKLNTQNPVTGDFSGRFF